MSLTDRFYRNHNLIITLKLKTKLKENDLDGCSLVKEEDDNYLITFSHQQKDGMTLLLHFYKENRILNQNFTLCSIDIDFLWIKFFQHLYNLKHPPYFNIPNSSLSYVNIKIDKSSLFSIYLKYGRVKFSSFLCAIQVFNYFKITNCPFCKLQIIHYLPHIDGINKTFPDVLIVPTFNFRQILRYIDTQRKTYIEMSNIYQKYNFFSNFISLQKQPPQFFDVTFSNLPYPIQIEDFQIQYKSLQYEKSYLNTLYNDTDDIFFSFVHDSSFEEMESSFRQILQYL